MKEIKGLNKQKDVCLWLKDFILCKWQFFPKWSRKEHNPHQIPSGFFAGIPYQGKKSFQQKMLEQLDTHCKIPKLDTTSDYIKIN
jgi:hypothetical protein